MTVLELKSLDDAHLSALVRALHEARFGGDPCDPLVAVSPLVVDLHVWSLEEQHHRNAAVRAEDGYAKFLTWKGRDEERAVVRRLVESPALLAMVSDDPDLLRDLLRPFVVTDEDLERMIAAGLERRDVGDGTQ